MNRLITLISLAVLLPVALNAQRRWSFDGNENFVLHTAKKQIELVDGVEGKGVRTDGYSTWIGVNFLPAEKVGSLSGWFALESFPTDTAAFFGLRNSFTEQSISVCVDRYGSIFLNRTPVNRKIEMFEWINLAVSLEAEEVRLWVNGKPACSDAVAAPRDFEFDELIIGSDFHSKMVGIHNVTAINGIIDEIELSAEPLDEMRLAGDVRRLGSRKPRLAIPAVRFADDLSRPRYHLLPAANWTNETHSLFYHNGLYHIFNQKNASNMFLGQINWGHYSSPDLVEWTEHKPALTPDPDLDPNGIWSGHAVVDNGVPTLIYTIGGPHMGVGIATPVDGELVEWRKYENNPVILHSPDGFHRTDMRDQYVWREDDTWYMIVGFGVVEEMVEKGAVLLYKSPDLKKWEFVHTMFEGNPDIDGSGIFWEMPVFWKCDDKYILLVNRVPNKGVPAVALYWSGDFIGERFAPDHPIPRKLEVVNRLLSPSVNRDKDGRTVTIAIIPDESGAQSAYERGWTHLYSIPRVWTIRNGEIWQTPHPALERLRGRRTLIPSTMVEKVSPLNISSDDRQIEARITIDPKGAQRFGFYLHRAPDNSEYTKIWYDGERGEIIVDQCHSSLNGNIPLRTRTGEYRLDPTREAEFRIFIDHSVVEVFINGRDAFTTRIFPSQEYSKLLDVFTADNPIEVNAEVWLMNSADIKADF